MSFYPNLEEIIERKCYSQKKNVENYCNVRLVEIKTLRNKPPKPFCSIITTLLQKKIVPRFQRLFLKSQFRGSRFDKKNYKRDAAKIPCHKHIIINTIY